MLGAGNIMKQWTFSTRYIATDEDEERWLQTVEYRFNPRFSYGIEYNPGDKSANLARIIWTLDEESERSPMITVSTSETRAGSVAGGHVNLTLAKSVPRTPFGAYVAVHYSVDRAIEYPFGASWQLNRNFSLLGMHDGQGWNVMLNFVHKDYWITVGSHHGEHPLIAIGFGSGTVDNNATQDTQH